MESDVRAELDKLHERITRLRERVTRLEAEGPYMTDALLRIEKSVEKLNGHISKGIWAVILLFIGVVVKFTVDGGWTKIPPIN